MDFTGLNDYELIYLVKEGSEPALNLLYQKYYILINKLSFSYCGMSDKRRDLVQEGVVIFFKSIYLYREDMMASFYVYLTIVVERRFAYLIKRSHYYDKVLVFNESLVTLSQDNSGISPLEKYTERMLTDEIDIMIYHHVILSGEPIKYFSERTGINYNSVAYRKKRMIKEFKNILTKI